MMIDCDACVARGPACGDCVVTVLLGAPPAHHTGDGEGGIDWFRRCDWCPLPRVTTTSTGHPVPGRSRPPPLRSTLTSGPMSVPATHIARRFEEAIDRTS
jgi:hypothetical protein